MSIEKRYMKTWDLDYQDEDGCGCTLRINEAREAGQFSIWAGRENATILEGIISRADLDALTKVILEAESDIRKEE